MAFFCLSDGSSAQISGDPRTTPGAACHPHPRPPATVLSYRWFCFGVHHYGSSIDCVYLLAPETINLDIALVKLAFPVSLNDAVNVICLPSVEDDFPPGTFCLTAGWGHTEEGTGSGFLRISHGIVYIIRRFNVWK